MTATSNSGAETVESLLAEGYTETRELRRTFWVRKAAGVLVPAFLFVILAMAANRARLPGWVSVPLAGALWTCALVAAWRDPIRRTPSGQPIRKVRYWTEDQNVVDLYICDDSRTFFAITWSDAA